MTKETIIRQFDFNLSYAEELVSDLSESQMTEVPSKGFENHPAFTLGHLITGSAGLVEDLGGTFDMDDKWKDLFLRKGPGDPRLPEPDRSAYPRKNQLLDELRKQHEKVKNLLLASDEAKLKQPIKWRFSKQMPTMIDLVVFMAINHEAMHLGQLAAWRRSMGLPSALSKL